MKEIEVKKWLWKDAEREMMVRDTSMVTRKHGNMKIWIMRII
jgi:hypothetical protein